MKGLSLFLGYLGSMAAAQFNHLPKSATSGSITPFEIKVAEQKIRDMATLIKLSPVGKPTFENLKTDGSLGLNRNWLLQTKKHWIENFKWWQYADYRVNTNSGREEQENYINSFPHFRASIPDEGANYDMHFMALFSDKRDAVPVVLLHGWPGMTSPN
jgi:microsomal epoxide hydrolase